MQVNFRGNINSTYQNKSNNNNKIKNAAITAAQWFGFGIGLDVVNYKFTAIKSPAKKSLFINTLIAAGAALITILHKNDSKKINKINKLV